MRFVDLPDGERMTLRAKIESTGAEVSEYWDGNVQAALPSPATPAISAIEALGLVLVPGSLHYFPLGSDKPSESLRHDGPYPGSKGFWLYASFACA
jgi:hypothetical protein